MAKTHHIIYLPGLGDNDFGRAQAWLLKFWRIYHVNAHYHAIGWADNESFGPKLDRILADIDRYIKPDNQVSLIGVSGGASAAINAYAARKQSVHRVVCVCGKIDNLQTISETRFKQNPAFKGSVDLLPDSLASLSNEDRQQILSLRPIRDGVVSPNDTIIEGAHQGLMLSVGHGFSIFYALTIGSFRIARFIKN